MNLSVQLDNASLAILRSIRLHCWPKTAAASHPSKGRNRSFLLDQKQRAGQGIQSRGHQSKKDVLEPGFQSSPNWWGKQCQKPVGQGPFVVIYIDEVGLVPEPLCFPGGNWTHLTRNEWRLQSQRLPSKAITCHRRTRPGATSILCQGTRNSTSSNGTHLWIKFLFSFAGLRTKGEEALFCYKSFFPHYFRNINSVQVKVR